MKQKRSDGSRLHGPRRIWVREFHWQPTMSIKGPDVARYADMFTALGAEPRLRIIRLLLSAHPDGMVVGDIQRELAITASNLSHHLEKLIGFHPAEMEHALKAVLAADLRTHADTGEPRGTLPRRAEQVLSLKQKIGAVNWLAAQTDSRCPHRWWPSEVASQPSASNFQIARSTFLP